MIGNHETPRGWQRRQGTMKEKVILAIREENKTLKMTKARKENQGMCCRGYGILQRDLTEAVGSLRAQRVTAVCCTGVSAEAD